ncbi:unnamed protein product [Clavelina lepadiformis]|uniref:SET domain-containing protein n=1 Tax=Clavelina lepadiformis TaxID=159417 RepID=A0ABP0GV48_CLALP
MDLSSCFANVAVERKQEEECDEDNYLYCEDCDKMLKNGCSVHSFKVPNSRMKWGMPKRAQRTCPRGILIGWSDILIYTNGARAIIDFPKNTVFGPYEGEYIDQHNMQRFFPSLEGGYTWGIYKNGKLSHYIDGGDESKSSWLRYIRRARKEEEQNVEAFQFQGKIYFRTIKNVAKRTELLFWYDKKYAEFLGLLTKEASRKKMEELAALPLSNNVLD